MGEVCMEKTPGGQSLRIITSFLQKVIKNYFFKFNEWLNYAIDNLSQGTCKLMHCSYCDKLKLSSELQMV